MEILKYLSSDISSEYSVTDEDWLNDRRKGIGGSDASTVLGLNKYKSRLTLYREKVEEYTEDLSNNVYIKKGKDLEDLIRLKYCTPYFIEKGYRLIKPNVTLIPKNTNFRANLDAFAVPVEFNNDYSKNIVVEIKWVSEYGEQLWNGDEYFGVPVNYYAQVQHYMYVTGAKKAVICALFDSDWQMHYYEIPYNADFVATLVREVNSFIEINVKMNIPPKVNSELDKDYILEAISHLPETTIEDEAMDTKIAMYKELSKNIKTLKSTCNEVLSDITGLYLKGHRPISPLHKVNISVVHSRRFNDSAFAEAYPELHKQFMQDTEYTRTTIK